MYLVMLGFQVQLFPDVEQEIEGVVGTAGLKRVAELKPVLLERADVELLIVEITVYLTAMTRETALVEMVPYGDHDMDDLHIIEMVVEHRQEVFVDAEDADGIQCGEHVVTDHILFVSGEGMQIECGGIGFLELLYGYHQHGGVDQYAGSGQVDGSGVGLEGFAEVGDHRNAAFHNVGLMQYGLFCIRRIRHRKRQRVVAHTYCQLLAVHDACRGHPLVDC